MTDTAASVEFVTSVFGSVTEACVFLSSLPNERDDKPPERFLLTRDTANIEAFAKRWDRPGRGLFFCVGTIEPDAPSTERGSPRCKANIAESCILHTDVDLKDIDIGMEEAARRVKALPLPPSVLVDSGNGLHVYWLLKEDIRPDEEFERLLRQLTDLVGGDPAVAEMSRLMRLPGSHNTKRGEWKLVTVLEADYGRRYDLADIEDMLGYVSPVISRKAAERPAGEPPNPFLAVAERLGFKPPIDVERRLAAMRYQGVGDASIHQTQLQVSASLLSRGTPAGEVAAILIDATRAAAGEAGRNWNWAREERAITRMCEEWLRKHPIEQKASPAIAKATGTTGAVVSLAVERGKKKPKARLDRQSVPVVVADGVIEAIRQAGQDIMLTEGEAWLYEAGTWHPMTPADQQWIQTLIQEGYETLSEPLKVAALNAAWKRLMEHPELFRRSVEWNKSGLLATPNGMLNPASRAFVAHSPDHFARRKIGSPFLDGAACPRFLTFLSSIFADRSDQIDYVSTVQTFFGASLMVEALYREERKALLLVGPSRTGKTELAGIFRRMIGDPIATPSVAEISERFGLASLYDAAAWIRDDAINEGDDLDPQKFKTIVTGEPIDIERKHRDAVRGVRLSIPVLLTTNSLPRARDKSDAIFNRCLVIELTNEVSEAEAMALRTKLGIPRGQALGAFIFEQEAAGILNWSLDGLARLMARGSYAIPENIRAANQRFKDDNNPVGEWARLGIVKAIDMCVARADLLCAYHGWQREQEGDEARALGARAFFPRLRALAPWGDETADEHGRRYICGIALTEEGLLLWERHNDAQLKGGSKGAALTRSEVNRPRPRKREETRF